MPRRSGRQADVGIVTPHLPDPRTTPFPGTAHFWGEYGTQAADPSADRIGLHYNGGR